MRRRILDGALAEFSTQGYGGSSINTICAAQNLSKGIVYHYFATKDALYLACMEECFQYLTEYVRANFTAGQGEIEAQLERYFSVRMSFFRANPVYRRLFCEAVTTPPTHLSAKIRACRQDFDAFNVQILEQLLGSIALRSGISKADAIETFRQYQDFINLRHQVNAANGQSLEAHEEDCRRMLGILLYGVIERN